MYKSIHTYNESLITSQLYQQQQYLHLHLHRYFTRQFHRPLTRDLELTRQLHLYQSQYQQPHRHLQLYQLPYQYTHSHSHIRPFHSTRTNIRTNILSKTFKMNSTDTKLSSTSLITSLHQMKPDVLQTPIHEYYALKRDASLNKQVSTSSDASMSNKLNDNGKSISSLQFDNRSLNELPVSTEDDPVIGAIFSLVTPTLLDEPSVVAVSSSALNLIDLSENTVKDPKFTEYFSGNEIIPGATMAAHCYCGYQFGSFSGQLGDGAVMYIGEILNQKQERVEIQFKGSGLTPYSRMGDGRKVLRSSIREFLCAEANYFLGIPTCRSATLLTSKSTVIRDQFYEGNARMENCAIITRLAPTFFRFGSFEICRKTDRRTQMSGSAVGHTEILQSLTEYTLKHFYPQIWSKWDPNSNATQIQCLLDLFATVCTRTAELVSKWQTFGFIHGVLNTDNMSILGITIDYGPYAYMDYYQSNFISNSSDDNGRYSYSAQPAICSWNCGQFAYALLDLPIFETLSNDELAEVSRLFSTSLQKNYWEKYRTHYFESLCRKFGFIIPSTDTTNEYLNKEALNRLFQDFFDTMQNTCADFTLSFRLLSQLSSPSSSSGLSDYAKSIDEILPFYTAICAPLAYYRQTLQSTMSERQLDYLTQMVQSGKFVDSTGRLDAERARKEKRESIQGWTNTEKHAADSDMWKSWFHMYCLAVKEDMSLRQQLSPDKSFDQLWHERCLSMKSNNPKYILRNWIAQVAIAKSEKGDHSEVHNILNRLEDPFAIDEDITMEEIVHSAGTDHPKEAFDTQSIDPSDPYSATCGVPVQVPTTVYASKPLKYTAPPPTWALRLRVSCSS